jgi:hypothetical protein
MQRGCACQSPATKREVERLYVGKVIQVPYFKYITLPGISSCMAMNLTPGTLAVHLILHLADKSPYSLLQVGLSTPELAVQTAKLDLPPTAMTNKR